MVVLISSLLIVYINNQFSFILDCWTFDFINILLVNLLFNHLIRMFNFNYIFNNAESNFLCTIIFVIILKIRFEVFM